MDFMILVPVWCGINLLLLSICHSGSIPLCELSVNVDGTTFCYWVIQTQQDVTSSEAICKLDNGTLANIPNDDSLLKLKALVTQKFPDSWTYSYVGYTRTLQGGITIRGTNHVQSFVPWDTANGQPEYKGICVGLMTLTGKFHDAFCFLEMYAVCSKTYILDITTDVTNDITTDIITNNTNCQCCETNRSKFLYPVNITKELQAKLDNLKKETEVNKETLSSTIRAKTSASDPRPSSAYVGYLGVAILTVIFGGILLMDMPRVITTFKRFYYR